MAKKNKLFSGRGYVPKGSYKRAEKKLQKGIFSVDDITKLSLEDIRDLKQFIKRRRKRIKTDGNDYPSEIAKRYNLLDAPLEDDPIELLDMYNQQEFYFEQLEIEMEANQHHEFDLMQSEDKWLILRRLATEDLMLNLDRAYASETLKTIEELIEANKKTMTYQELSDALLEGKFDEYQFDRMHPEDGLRPFANKPNPFDVKSQALAQNRGFHGVDKAMAKYRREREATSLHNYTSLWSPLDDIPIDWNAFKE